MHGRGAVGLFVSRLVCLFLGHRFSPGVSRALSLRCWCTRCDQVVVGDLGVR